MKFLVKDLIYIFICHPMQTQILCYKTWVLKITAQLILF